MYLQLQTEVRGIFYFSIFIRRGTAVYLQDRFRLDVIYGGPVQVAALAASQRFISPLTRGPALQDTAKHLDQVSLNAMWHLCLYSEVNSFKKPKVKQCQV